jgi:hypothetical protein
LFSIFLHIFYRIYSISWLSWISIKVNSFLLIMQFYAQCFRILFVRIFLCRLRNLYIDRLT